jgi:hypothetical protein
MNITNDLNVFGTTTTSQSQNLLIGDNCAYLNDGYVIPAGLAGCVVVNYLPTSNNASVVAGGFTAGIAATSNPTVVTDNGFAWTAGDIIQISGANDQTNDGLFEVDSYANPILTIRGVGLTGPTFSFFQNQFDTDATAGGTITQVNVSVISSGTDGIWEVNNPQDSTVGMAFNDLTTAVGASPYTQVGAIISPVSANVNAILAGQTNTISASISRSAICGGISNSIVPSASTSERHFIAGGTSNLIQTNTNNGAQFNSAVVGGNNHQVQKGNCGVFCGTNNDILRSGDPNFGGNCAIVAGINNTVSDSGTGNVNSSVIAGGGNNLITGTGSFAGGHFIGGGSNNTINPLGEGLDHSCILGGNTNYNGGQSCGILAGETNTINAPNPGPNDPIANAIVGGRSNRIGFTGGGAPRILDSAIVGGNGNFINGNFTTSLGQRCFIGGGQNNTIQCQPGTSNSVVLGGASATINHTNCFMFNTGNALASTTTNQWTVNATNGSRFFSNAGATTGVTLAAGGISWAAASDKNKKENLVEVSSGNILQRVVELPIYEYNFIGNPKEQKCIGPVAQDWHSLVTPLETYIEEEEDKNGEIVQVEKEAKDKLSIETMDAIGVCLASIKALAEQNEKLSLRIETLEKQNELLLSKNQQFEEMVSKLGK